MTELREDERNAMRAYLQRVEVRLSTMHRVASAFLGGAGLLILFPVFFNNAITGLIKTLVLQGQDGLTILTSIILGVPVFLSIGVPVYALGLLLRDLVHFYFVGHSPGFPSKLFNPRFVLSGIAFSPDESMGVKHDVLVQQYSTDLINFILPFGEAQASYFDQVIISTRGQILPTERTIDKLVDNDVIKNNTDENELLIQSEPNEKRSKQDIERFAAALGLAGTRDRKLVSEVAKGEASLIRHALGLRRLVLRYMKALLMFILTTLLSFTLVAVVNTERVPQQIVLAIGYLVWAFLMPIVVKLPMRWIYDIADPRSESVVQHDIQLVEFEKVARTASWVAMGLSTLGLVFGTMALLVTAKP